MSGLTTAETTAVVPSLRAQRREMRFVMSCLVVPLRDLRQ